MTISKRRVREELAFVKTLCPGAHNEDGTCEWCNAAEILAGNLTGENLSDVRPVAGGEVKP